MPIIRATVTVADAAPKRVRPTASTAAVLRGVTVSPKPRPKSPPAAATTGYVTSGVPRAHPGEPRDRRGEADRGHARAATRGARASPETSAPTAVAAASAPSASRWSSGPPYRTRSTKTAEPTIAVANA